MTTDEYLERLGIYDGDNHSHISYDTMMRYILCVENKECDYPKEDDYPFSYTSETGDIVTVDDAVMFMEIYKDTIKGRI